MIRLEHTTIPVVALSHPGLKRKNNEDRYGVSSFQLGPGGPDPILLVVLSDGIGGHRAGEVAAELTVNRISQIVAASTADDPPLILHHAIQSTSQEIRDQALHNLNQSGMGATCACAWVLGDKLYIATVGDSRVYLLREGVIHRLTIDHTWVQEAIERGVIKPEEAPGHPNAHVIRRYLGSPTPPDVDLRVRINGEEDDERMQANQGLLLKPGDRIFLCSDGLTDVVNDAEILASFQEKTIESGCQNLIELANARGGPDNITIVAIHFPGKRAVQLARQMQVRRKITLWKWVGAGCLVIVAIAALAALFLGGYWWLTGDSQLWPAAGPTATQPVVSPSTTPQPGPVENPADTAIPTLFQTLPTPSGGPPSPTPPASLPIDSGPTLTPWPTNTVNP